MQLLHSTPVTLIAINSKLQPYSEGVFYIGGRGCVLCQFIGRIFRYSYSLKSLVRAHSVCVYVQFQNVNDAVWGYT